MALVIVEDPIVKEGEESADTEIAVVLRSLGENFAQLRFPMKVWRLASEPSFEPIKWAESGKSLVIDEPALEPVLGHFFRSDKYSSFLRQLHLYGFRKMSTPRCFKALPNKDIIPEKNRKYAQSGIAEYAAKDFERDRFDNINKVRRFYSKAAREKKANHSSGSGSLSSSLSSETVSEATLFSEERRKQLLAEHSYHSTGELQQQQPAHSSSLPTSTALTVPTPILSHPLSSFHAEAAPANHVPSQNPGHFIYHPFPLIYSPSTGTYSQPGIADGFGARGFSYYSPQQISSYSPLGSVPSDQGCSRDSGISDSSFSSTASKESVESASSFFNLMDPSQPCAIAYYPLPVMMPSGTAPH